MNLRIGSRGSQLALWQANHIAALLRAKHHTVDIQIIKTTGDRLQEVTFAQVGSKGMFTKEIEEALDAGTIDLAVHSLKDLPTELPELFVLAATPPRVDPRDVFVSVNYSEFVSSSRRRKGWHQQPASSRAIESSPSRHCRGRVSRQRRHAPAQTRRRPGGCHPARSRRARSPRKNRVDSRAARPRRFLSRSRPGRARHRDAQRRSKRRSLLSPFLDDRRHAFRGDGGACGFGRSRRRLPGAHRRSLPRGSGIQGWSSRWPMGRSLRRRRRSRKRRSDTHPPSRAPRSGSDPEVLGRVAAKKLIEAGAGPLLEAIGGVAR